MDWFGVRLGMNAIEKLREVTDTIGSAKNGLVLVDSWALAGRLLSRFPVDQAQAGAVLKSKDHAGLDAIVRGLEQPVVKTVAEAPKVTVTEADMQAAMRAFRKRLKLTRLDEESKLGGRYVSGGKKSGIEAIAPPNDFPPAVWKALVAAGRLREAGPGFLADVESGKP